MHVKLSVDKTFKALADKNRRALLDDLFALHEGGLTLSQLCKNLNISRQAVSKHLAILQQSGLIVSHRVGREKQHFLNPIPIQEIGERWINKYAQHRAGAITALNLGSSDHGSRTDETPGLYLGCASALAEH